jgi:hypothetical protein
MSRSVSVEASNGVVETMLYAVGDAQDFISRERLHVYALIEQVDSGQLSACAAKLAMRDVFDAAEKDLGEWRGMIAADAKRVGFPYLHEDLGG